MMAQLLGGLLQIGHSVGSNRLNNVGFDVTKRRVHLRGFLVVV
jgi:hypothetical protein